MKHSTVLKPLANFFFKLIRRQSASAAPPRPERNLAEEQQLRETLLMIESEDSGPGTYRHWGLNE